MDDIIKRQATEEAEDADDIEARPLRFAQKIEIQADRPPTPTLEFM